ncbi:hypothetical protein [Chitinophaga sp. OAE865]|uniref:hypothetical protein n=1 Tax=Chitinophaga sp. OAE865 TaxID=2817898 RepID=UPI001AE95CFB
MLDQHIGERIRASFGRQKLMQFYGATILGIGSGTIEIAVLPLIFSYAPPASFMAALLQHWQIQQEVMPPLRFTGKMFRS